MRLLLIFVFAFTSILYPNNISNKAVEKFIHNLIFNPEKIEVLIDSEELKLSKRLGITYEGITNKVLISIDIDPELKEKVKKNALKYNFKVNKLDSIHSLISVTFPSLKQNYKYYLKNDKLISSPSYYAKDWLTKTSEFFEFRYSDEGLINEYSIKQLDAFVKRGLALLNFKESEIQKLQKNKIHYLLCKDKQEIKKLTGYEARGMYYLANDYVISTFNCHYHEIAHLLINLKIKNNKLYTSPFLLEGFAVALGGRGGKETNVILNMGKYLVESNFVSYNELLSINEFYTQNASISYPVAGLYAKFLINNLGIENFINLYKKHSSCNANIKSIKEGELPNESEWKAFLENNDFNSLTVSVNNFDEYKYSVLDKNSIKIKENEYSYLIKLKDKVGLKGQLKESKYTSKIFKELLPNKVYNDEQLLLIANENEVSIYDLYTNNLIAKYVSGFTKDQMKVNNKEGFYTFVIDKSLLEKESFSIGIVEYN